MGLLSAIARENAADRQVLVQVGPMEAERRQRRSAYSDCPARLGFFFRLSYLRSTCTEPSRRWMTTFALSGAATAIRRAAITASCFVEYAPVLAAFLDGDRIAQPLSDGTT